LAVQSVIAAHPVESGFPLMAFSGWTRIAATVNWCLKGKKGYFLGSIYFNYGLTALLFPVWFFRSTRCLWMAMDHFFDPAPRSS